MINAHGSIATIAYGMDTKTYVELSEAFTKLAITYQSDIKRDSVTTHLTQMVKDTFCFLSAIKVHQNAVSIASFILKQIVKQVHIFLYLYLLILFIMI